MNIIYCYRVLKKYYRSEETGKVSDYYRIQCLKKFWYSKEPKWVDVTKRVCYGVDCYNQVIEYNELEDACRHIENLNVIQSPDEVVKCK